MAVISVVGTSGVGKSFLIKQLAAMTQSPAFFEGEEGTIPKDVLNNIFDGGNPLPRWKFFMELYKKNLLRARKISDKQKINCFVDGAFLSARAILAQEDKKYFKALDQLVKKYEKIKPDLLVLLVASPTCLKDLIKQRGRVSEKIGPALKRALVIQSAFLSLARKNKNILVIDRSGLDFTKYKDIFSILKKINLKI